MNVPGEGVPSSTCQSHYVNIDNKKKLKSKPCVCVSGILKCLNVLHMFYALKKTPEHTHTTLFKA